MAKKNKKGRSKKKPNSTPKKVIHESLEKKSIPSEKVDSLRSSKDKEGFFSKIYNLSIGGIRLVAIILVLLGLTLIAIGSISLLKTIKGKVDDNQNVEGNIDSGIQDSTNDSNENEEEDNDETATQKPEVQNVSENAKLARIASHNKSVKTGKWVATNYKPGDIKSGNYEVQRGDTLWEIAEAVYGNGAQWHKILDANSSSIGFLPNGSQAKIIPGQVIVLP